ncbi:MAG TPA: MerR family transcriptional regulator [Gammaproteobacteria bacterium]|nr:MerR family transcriptional regulator [Gammaproteobacteria bacterium]
MADHDDKEDGLTAAECAARTGLTVRALRVYEDYGLLAPKRTAGGWRWYGKAELVRLNTIGLLKTAGLTLAQIRQVTMLSARGPSLRQVLEMQIDAWEQRKAEAVHGHAVTEAALRSLNVNDSLSVDELCNLVRSMEMSDRSPDSSGPPAKPSAITLDAAILDRYVGHYKVAAYSVLTITREGGRLLARMPFSLAELTPLSETEFVGSITQSHYTFVTDEEGIATGLMGNLDGIEVTWPRIDDAARDEIKAKLAARIESKTPVPGSESALRRLREGIRNGAPNYDEMSPALAQLCRKQLPQLEMTARFLGDTQSIEFQGVGSQGWDVYEVRCENGTVKWRIALTDGVIVGAAAAFADGP